MSATQTKFQVWARHYVKAHNSGFATPQVDGTVLIYSYYSGPAASCLYRELAATVSDVRRILGY